MSEPTIKALSLTQPWSSLVIIGAKSVETRFWRFIPKYRGLLAIHAAKGYPRDAQRFTFTQPCLNCLRAADQAPALHPLKRGYLLGTVELVDAAFFTSENTKGLSDQELAFGDFTVGRLGLWLRNPRPLKVPVPFKGALGLFDVPERLLQSAPCASPSSSS